MRTVKKFGVLLAAVFALSAIAVGTASAEFTWSAAGSLVGAAEETQVLTLNGGTVQCLEANSEGPLEATQQEDIHVTVHYRTCKAFGIVTVHIFTATYTFTTDGIVHIMEPITITVTKTLFTGHCTITVPKQTVGTVDYVNINGNTEVTFNPTVTGIDYTSTGGVCGTSGTNGTYTGASIVKRVGGGSFSVDH